MGKQNTTITLSVDTDNITESTKNTATEFSDNRGDPPTPGDPANFTSIVTKNFMVYWSAVGKDNIGTVEIMDVIPCVIPLVKKDAKEKEIIKNIKKKSNNNNNWQWQAKVKNDAGIEPGDYEKYMLIIKVDNDSSKVFTIDPKLKIPLGNY